MTSIFSTIVPSGLACESTADARRRIASYVQISTESSDFLIVEICVTPTLTPSSYFTDNA
jgi:hypothetical protein